MTAAVERPPDKRKAPDPWSGSEAFQSPSPGGMTTITETGDNIAADALRSVDEMRRLIGECLEAVESWTCKRAATRSEGDRPFPLSTFRHWTSR